MPEIILTIGDKNVSSWSFRPWFLMTHANIPFTEQNIKLDQPQTRDVLNSVSPSGLVPFLHHGENQIWDSLAIMEYISDLFPDKNLWPSERGARGVARSIAAEMHSGFYTLREVWPMQFMRKGLEHLTTGGVAAEIERIDILWTRCRRDFGASGEFLFGDFSIADAMFAPIVSRFLTYGPLELSDDSSAYMRTISATPAWSKWEDGAESELRAG